MLTQSVTLQYIRWTIPSLYVSSYQVVESISIQRVVTFSFFPNRWEWRPGVRQVYESSQMLRSYSYKCQVSYLRYKTQCKYQWGWLDETPWTIAKLQWVRPGNAIYQSPLILTELSQHNLMNVTYLTACYLYQVMMTLYFLNDVANDTESTQK